MIKFLFHKTAALIMAILVLVSTVSFTVEQHFCAGNLIDVAFFTDVEKCGFDSSDDTDSKIEIKSCCQDKVEIFIGQDHLKVDIPDDIDVGQKLVFSIDKHIHKTNYSYLKVSLVAFETYIPPNLITDFRVSHQVFLI